jgi:hypothetical protein
VRAAGVASRLPLDLGRSRISITPEGFERPEGEAQPTATHRLVGTGYAETMGFRLVEGRFLDRRDEADGPKHVLVNRTLADRFWPDGNALGRTFYGPEGVVWLTVAGIVEDVREESLDGPTTSTVYIPHRDWAWRTMQVVVHTEGPPLELLPTLKEAVWAVDPAVPVSSVRTVEDVVARSYRGLSMTARLFGLFALLALALGAVGVYGVMAFTMGRRRHEMGIRVALGASRSTLLRHALGGAGRTLALGLAAGVAGAPLVRRVLQASVTGVGTASAGTLAAAALVLAGVALTASYLPARKAAAADPTESLSRD